MKNKQYIEPSPQGNLQDNSQENFETRNLVEGNHAAAHSGGGNPGTSLLRFITAGSVDDGKSTLIGRLMYDTKSIFKDQLEAIERSSRRRGDEQVNLALLTDGLRAEREQGITIDVAYRYFSTPKRKFIMADTPGHVEYTRNMVTGASTADLSIILIDARHGIVEQTRRHTYIALLLGIRHIVVAVNKMDLVGYAEDIFENIKSQYLEIVQVIEHDRHDQRAQVCKSIDIRFVPISARDGDNVVNVSANMPWYKGKTVLETLETVEMRSDEHGSARDDRASGDDMEEIRVKGVRSEHGGVSAAPGRFPVQRVIRPQSQSPEHADFRGYAGRVEEGIFHPGDSVMLLPSGVISKIEKIYKYKEELAQATASESVVMTLADKVDISRGDMIVTLPDKDAMQVGGVAQLRKDDPVVSNEFSLDINWFSDTKLNPGGTYILKHTTHETKAKIQSAEHKINIHTLKREMGNEHGLGNGIGAASISIGKNDIARITLKTAKPIFYDPYAKNRVTGSVILIDEFTNETVAAGMIV
jgi:sulfate adenylyltransferase subunit 1